jgi:hypothetical protein
MSSRRIIADALIYFVSAAGVGRGFSLRVNKRIFQVSASRT